MTETQATPDDNGSWLMELFNVKPFTPEEQAEHDAIAKPLIAAQAMSDEACRARVNEILRASSPNVCPKCNGSGNVGYRRAGGVCFRCDGVGFLSAE